MLMFRFIGLYHIRDFGDLPAKLIFIIRDRPNSRQFRDRRASLYTELICSFKMLIEVLSSDLDPLKTWFVLTRRLCGTTPSKFFNSDLFKVFKDEVLQCNLNDLSSKDGRSVAAKLHDNGVKIVQNKVYVGTFFSIFAGNLRRKNLTESEFLISKEFFAAKERLSLQDPATQPWHSTPAKKPHIENGCEDKENSKKNINTSVGPKKRSNTSCSFLEVSGSSTSSDSGMSLRDIDEHNYRHESYKKRKVKQKCQTVMNEINDICSRNGEDLETFLARSCLQSGNLGDESKEVVRGKVTF